uniref:Uncharacterized protein n=1 Tax=Knipowitschia caucasica TaxID=637954 RepID=A0AAV2MB12_KNICA
MVFSCSVSLELRSLTADRSWNFSFSNSSLLFRVSVVVLLSSYFSFMSPSAAGPLHCELLRHCSSPQGRCQSGDFFLQFQCLLLQPLHYTLHKSCPVLLQITCQRENLMLQPLCLCLKNVHFTLRLHKAVPFRIQG